MSVGRFIEVIKPGMLTLVQDLGRYGYQQFGVPVAGAMDQFAAAAANLLVGNDRSDAVLEMMMLGPELKIGFKGCVALTGADLGPKINGSPVAMWQTLEVQAGDVLSFGGLKSGLRGYLAVAGGIDTPLVMNSRSTYTKAALGGFEGRALKAGDQVPVGSAEAERPAAMLAIPAELVPVYSVSKTVRIVLGPQNDAFTNAGLQTFLDSVYTVTNECDRMGYRLEGPSIEHVKGGDIISDGIAFGAVQVPGHGKPIIMMADRQTTGGYTKIAGVISVDLPLLAQSKPGDQIRFKRVSLEEAHELLKAREDFYSEISEMAAAQPIDAVVSLSSMNAEIISTRLFRLNVAGAVYDVKVEEVRV
ncbi:biotin-dependent carboxyltransferase family protein [Acidaminobacter sp.]|uniref:5-oxoprolinase subunit C family protein n=1 Tax=Acidaminobacter sp. TaxID=1872102 RepID=UPI0013838880|nr:biotin-dependent carboxyltransferase family protein [Acidaminobacter sp.]MDK9710619.1 biotin-dependent carboxyltransferase family protein [Acidaminobacter sp.]MZQ96394.1 5-oxoprolinase/urea amidolyase family protein [Acidaminobacter sp.]